MFHFLCPEQSLKKFTVWEAAMAPHEALEAPGEAPGLSQAVNAHKL